MIAAVAGLLLLLAALLFLRHQHGSRSTPPGDLQITLEKAIGIGRPFYLSPGLYEALPGKSSSLTPSRLEAGKASLNPTLFHALNRDRHFSVVLLSCTEGSAPLAQELLSSPRWILTRVAPWGFRFEPLGDASSSPSAWVIPSEEALLALHPLPEERTDWLLGTAANLISINRPKEAEQLLSMAAATKKFPSRVLAGQASLAASRGRWSDALLLGRNALGKNSSNDAAREILIRALTESGHPDEALDEARKLVQRQRNTETLFLLARAANAANSENEEIAALQGLVELGRKNNQPLGASLTYLGQALAKNGRRGAALRAFSEALDSPELSEEQRQMIRQLADHITLDQPRK